MTNPAPTPAEPRVMRCPDCGRVASVPDWCERPVCVHAWEGNTPEVWDDAADPMAASVDEYWRLPGKHWAFMVASQPAADTPTFRVPYSDEPGGRRHPTYETECECCGTRLRVTNNYSPMGDFLDQTVQPAADTLDVRLRNARIVAEYWRDAYMREIEEQGTTLPWGIGTHPLACVIGALDGETDPKQMGVEPDEFEKRAAAYRDAKGTPPVAGEH